MYKQVPSLCGPLSAILNLFDFHASRKSNIFFTRSLHFLLLKFFYYKFVLLFAIVLHDTKWFPCVGDSSRVQNTQLCLRFMTVALLCKYNSKIDHPNRMKKKSCFPNWVMNFSNSFFFLFVFSFRIGCLVKMSSCFGKITFPYSFRLRNLILFDRLDKVDQYLESKWTLINSDGFPWLRFKLCWKPQPLEYDYLPLTFRTFRGFFFS